MYVCMWSSAGEERRRSDGYDKQVGAAKIRRGNDHIRHYYQE